MYMNITNHNVMHTADRCEAVPFLTIMLILNKTASLCIDSTILQVNSSKIPGRGT